VLPPSVIACGAGTPCGPWPPDCTPVSTLRHRQRLLSLKYSTIEASFSVPMLQLTLGHMPFTIGFAVKALGWGASGVGLLAATFFLGYVLQPPISFVLQRYLSQRAIVQWTFVANALPWLLVLLFPYVSPAARDVLFAAIAYVSAQANAVCGVAWAASMSEIVPLPMRGRFFGRRNLIYGFWALLAVLAAGQLADWTRNSLHFFGVLFAAAAVSRLVGLHFFNRMAFPSVVTQRRREPLALSVFRVPLTDRGFLWALAFNGLCGLLLFSGLPFYSVFVLRELHMSLGALAVMTTMGNLAGLLSVNTWGPLTDRFGVRPVMAAGVMLWTTSASLLWLLTGPRWPLLAYAGFVVYGFMWALFQLLQLTMMINLAPAAHRTYYISTFYASTYLLTFLGPFLGGYLLERLPLVWGQLFGQPLTRYHIVFVGSLLLCLATLPLLRRVVEPTTGSLRDVMRHMRTSAEINPFLMLVSVAQILFGGRAIEILVRQSRRAMRRHANALADVGEELAQGSWRALSRPFRRD
jgi:hypothetical protein